VEKNKGRKVSSKAKGMAQSKFLVHDKRNGNCYYCGKPRNHPKDCYKMKYNESKQRNIRHNGNLVDKCT